VVLRGGADGDLTADAFTHMLEKLRTRGIRKIEGNLVLDRQLWQPARNDVGVPPFDESPEAYYNLIPDALLLNMNLQTLDITSDAKSIKASALPELANVHVRSEMTLVDGDCAKWEDGWKVPEYVRSGARLTVVLKGTFPRNCSKTNVVNVLDRTDYAERLFRATWERLGGRFSGKALEASTEQSRAFHGPRSCATPTSYRTTAWPAPSSSAWAACRRTRCWAAARCPRTAPFPAATPHQRP
jgi:D-alanyl-D-alanine carboxypeptidase/D-alanyl-D-alanine-endopeptidase (penicillin-binding protein 4)